MSAPSSSKATPPAPSWLKRLARLPVDEVVSALGLYVQGASLCIVATLAALRSGADPWLSATLGLTAALILREMLGHELFLRKRYQLAAPPALTARAGEPGRLDVVLSARWRQPLPVRLAIADQSSPWQWLSADGPASLSVETAPLARGRHPVPSCELWFASGWGMGRISRPAPVSPAAFVRVWPAPWRGPRVEVLWGARRRAGEEHPALEGETARPNDPRATTREGTGPDLRPWRSGDRMGCIDHKASAKCDAWMTRVAPPPQAPAGEEMLRLEWALAHTRGNKEQALSLLAAVAEYVWAQGSRVGVSTPQGTVPADRGAAHRRRLLDHLADEAP